MLKPGNVAMFTRLCVTNYSALAVLTLYAHIRLLMAQWRVRCILLENCFVSAGQEECTHVCGYTQREWGLITLLMNKHFGYFSTPRSCLHSDEYGHRTPN